MATECPLRCAEMLVWGEVRPTGASARRWQQRHDRKTRQAFSKGPQQGVPWKKDRHTLNSI